MATRKTAEQDFETVIQAHLLIDGYVAHQIDGFQASAITQLEGQLSGAAMRPRHSLVVLRIAGQRLPISGG
jgi:hypothetical protein